MWGIGIPVPFLCLIVLVAYAWRTVPANPEAVEQLMRGGTILLIRGPEADGIREDIVVYADGHAIQSIGNSASHMSAPIDLSPSDWHAADVLRAQWCQHAPSVQTPQPYYVIGFRCWFARIGKARIPVNELPGPLATLRKAKSKPQ
jgi:hypothetical protein